MIHQNYLKEALLPLIESSQTAIADVKVEKFDVIKEYLHVERKLESN
jgi:hypothetical protein